MRAEEIANHGPPADHWIDRAQRRAQVGLECPPGGLAGPYLDDPEAFFGGACNVDEQALGRPPQQARYGGVSLPARGNVMHKRVGHAHKLPVPGLVLV